MIKAEAGNSITYALLESNGTVINSGQIVGDSIRAASAVRGGTLTNYGSIISSGGQDGVRLGSQGNIVNDGFITGINAYSGGIVTNGGTIDAATPGRDAISFGLGASQLVIDPGATFGGEVIASGQAKHQELEFASSSVAGSVAGLGSEIVGFGNIIFDPGASWTIEGDTAGLATGQIISGFATGDTIVLDNVLATSDSFVTGTGLELTSGSSTITLDLAGTFSTASFSVTESGANTTIATTAPCFAAGTRILTTRGEIAVEALNTGDVAILHNNCPAPITWIGQRTIDITRHPHPETVQPVLIEAGALDHAIPSRNLLVSPDHALFLAGALIPAKTLINGATIRQIAPRRITYFHIELAQHGILQADACFAESYLDTGNRGAFENGGTAIILHPDFAQSQREAQSCAPFMESGPVVANVRAAIATTTDAALHIVHHAGSAIVTSNSAIPGHITPDPRDRRRLGVKIARLLIDGTAIPLDHPDLTQGWHALEPDGRWTDGAAVIPATLLAGSRQIELSLAATLARYPCMPRSETALTQ